MHVSGKFSRKQDIDLIKQDIDPINDPINTAGLSEREKKRLFITSPFSIGTSRILTVNLTAKEAK